MMLSDKLRAAIRDVRDYPSPGIIFKDITPVLANPSLCHEVAAHMVEQMRGTHIDAIAAVEARGFIFGAILAHQLNCSFIPVRKAGKLPYKKKSMEYNLEYGSASIEIHVDAVKPGWKVMIHDDLLATGGTAGAAADLITSMGGVVSGFSFMINLSFLPGEKNLTERFGIKPDYLVSY